MTRNTLLLAAVFFLGAVGSIVGMQNQQETAQAQIADCATPWACVPVAKTPDPDVYSSLTVYHKENDENGDAVEPDDLDGEDWTITAKYVSTQTGVDCNCQDETYEATVDVRFDRGPDVWSIDASSYTSPFQSITICDEGDCSSDNSPYYKLEVELNNSIYLECPVDGWRTFYLSQVLYTTTHVGDGDLCAGGAVQAETQVFQTGDNGQFECTGTCPFGPSIVISYSN